MRKIWIVEDNALYSKALKMTVSSIEGVVVEQVYTNAEDALKAMDGPGQELDLLLLDVELPGVSGLEAISQFLTLAPELKIVILTQHNEMDYVLRAMAEGASGYYLKSSPHDQLCEAIEMVFSEDAVIDPRLTKYLVQGLRQKESAEPEISLTEREREILSLLVQGQSKKEMAQQLHISYHTVDKHVRSLYKKLDVNNVSSAVAKAMQLKLVGV